MEENENTSTIKYNKEAKIKKRKKHQMRIALTLVIIEVLIFILLFGASNIALLVSVRHIFIDLKEGDYIEYNVEYKDAYTNKNYTKKTGWRVCNPGKAHLDGTYDGVELISTGIPIRLYYDSDKIKEADGVKNYPWKIGTRSQEMDELRETEEYDSNVFRDAGGMAAGGLYYNFPKMKVLAFDPGGDPNLKTGGYETGAVWRKNIVKNGKEIRGEQSIKDIFLIKGKTKSDGIECISLDSIKGQKERRRQSDRARGLDTIPVFLHTDLNDLSEPYLYFKVPEDQKTIVWNPDNQDSRYWLATPYSGRPKRLRYVQIDKEYEEKVNLLGSENGNYGIRPIIKLKDHSRLKRIK